MGRKGKKRHGRAPATPGPPPARDAASSSPEPAPHTAPPAGGVAAPSARGAWTPVLVLLVVLLGAGALGVALSGGDDRAPTAGQAASVPRTGTAPGTAAGTEPHASGDRGGGTAATGADTRVPPGTAAALFAVTCAPCHSLAAVRRLGAPHGTIGPDLDELRPSRERVLAAIRNGGLGGGLMPSGLLGPRGAKRVAAYVARVAGGRADASPP